MQTTAKNKFIKIYVSYQMLISIELKYLKLPMSGAFTSDISPFVPGHVYLNEFLPFRCEVIRLGLLTCRALSADVCLSYR